MNIRKTLHICKEDANLVKKKSKIFQKKWKSRDQEVFSNNTPEKEKPNDARQENLTRKMCLPYCGFSYPLSP